MRVSIDELDYSDYHVYLYQGKPFTGIAYESLADGRIVAEDSYVDGVLKGYSKEWYPTGELQSEVYYMSGALHGKCRQWYIDGTLKSEYLYEYGILITKKEWDENGKLFEEYKIDESDSRIETLEKFRELKKE
jgi:antitoxin component YwqK of YwqJK toxin-antitoxin module